MHDKLYETQKSWVDLDEPSEAFAGYARELGLNADQFKEDVGSQAIKDVVEADMKDGTDLNVQGTPTIYVGGEKSTDYNLSTLKELIEKAAKK